MATLKPLRPLQFEGQNLYPLTTYDQIIMPDGKKWNGTTGADVVIEPTITSGTKLATISVDGVSKDLYYQASAVTLNGSATTSANFYAPINSGTAGQVLKSSGSGAPVWGNGDKIVDGTNIVKPYSTTQSSRTGLMAYNTSTNQYLYLYTENASTGDLKIATNANDDSGNHYATVYTTLNKPTAADVGALPISGGTVTGNINIQGTSFPSFCLQPTSANSAGTYTGGFFEGSYTDNVSMWVWTDRNNSTKSRRGLVLYGYAQQADDKYALALRRCDTSGNWQSDLNVLHSGNYSSYALPLSGGTLTGSVACKGYFSLERDSYPQIQFHNGSGNPRGLIYMSTNTGTVSSMYFRVYTDDTGSNYVSAYLGTSGDFHANTVYGAVWNDYAEFRTTIPNAKPGQVVIENGNGSLRLSTERLQPGCEVVSDTFGFAIGETDNCKTPIAASGRVLAYTYEDRDTFVAGEPVCSGPNGTVSRMTREEAKEYPERIIGTVSEIPTYKTWGSGNVEVNGRIWIRIK